MDEENGEPGDPAEAPAAGNGDAEPPWTDPSPTGGSGSSTTGENPLAAMQAALRGSREPGVGADAYATLDLALRIGELMLAGGDTAASVDLAMARIARAYGLPHTENDVTLAAVGMSYLPRGDRPPVTAERRVRRRTPNYTRLIAVDRMVREAATGLLGFQQAKFRLSDIIGQPTAYPPWAQTVALSVLGGAGAVLVGGGPYATLAAFVATLLGDRTGAWLGRRGIADFFQMTVAAAIGTLVTVLLVATDAPVRAGTVIIGVVIALIPGRALVVSMQDGIAGDLVTGTTRLVEVLFVIVAILSGIGAVTYLAARTGVAISLAHLPTVPTLIAAPQTLGAAAIAVTFAVYHLVSWRFLPPVAVGGMLSWAVLVEMRGIDLPPAPATAIAATVVGLLGTAYARLTHVPALVCVTPCIAPLMPGTLMYRGMLELTAGRTGPAAIVLAEALATALAIGAGVYIGGELLRMAHPARRVLRTPRRVR
ncbi:threonine/serine ThrE exporter family protein [Actinomadura oligospora]|uniref:threonine/serine ThrE exporter family protein n=1 Tax=Actinomadura oligospora TaxID=111804 RepID=UPI0004BC2C30|nr:threonine/serine exporter family protein [Actinomadura oligospora]